MISKGSKEETPRIPKRIYLLLIILQENRNKDAKADLISLHSIMIIEKCHITHQQDYLFHVRFGWTKEKERTGDYNSPQ